MKKSLQDLHEWFEENVQTDIGSVTCIKKMYKYYLEFVTYDLGILAVKPRTFTRELKIFVAKDVEMGRVDFFYKNESMVRGLKVK